MKIFVQLVNFGKLNKKNIKKQRKDNKNKKNSEKTRYKNKKETWKKLFITSSKIV